MADEANVMRQGLIMRLLNIDSLGRIERVGGSVGMNWSLTFCSCYPES